MKTVFSLLFVIQLANNSCLCAAAGNGLEVLEILHQLRRERVINKFKALCRCTDIPDSSKPLTTAAETNLI